MNLFEKATLKKMAGMDLTEAETTALDTNANQTYYAYHVDYDTDELEYLGSYTGEILYPLVELIVDHKSKVLGLDKRRNARDVRDIRMQVSSGGLRGVGVYKPNDDKGMYINAGEDEYLISTQRF